jgi:hypothetical protein
MALHSSSNFVKSSIRESLDYSSEYLWTRRDVRSTSVGNIASIHILVRKVSILWPDLGSYAEPIVLTIAFSSISQHKALI